MLKQTYTVEEVAKLLGIGRATAYAAVKRGEIKCIRIGRRVIIPAIAIDNLLLTAVSSGETDREARKEEY